MSRVAVVLLRIGLGFVGAWLLLFGAMNLIIGDLLRSDSPPLSPAIEWSFTVGAFGYGLLLVVPAWKLARARWLVGLVVACTAAFLVAAVVVRLEWSSVLSTAAFATGFVVPAALALWQIRRARCNPTARFSSQAAASGVARS